MFMDEVRVIVQCKNVSKIFNMKGSKIEVIKNINLRVNENEFVVILGPGQCGKTTLLNLMSGLEKVTSGEIIVNGQRVEGPNPELGMVYQRTALFSWLTVRGNIAFGPQVRGMKKNDWMKKSQYFIDLVGLAGFEDRFPVQLSGGMKQRVGIARAYCNDPVLLFMDEPFGHLDAQTRYMMQGEVERIWDLEKRTILFVTNNIEEAIYLADRIIVLKNSPTNVKTEFQINLPRPRNNLSPEFLELRRKINGSLEKTR
jgi:NitT/TauT family transport system ATP-binding protein/sulfonate transport system ATP-binding protein